MAIEDKDLLKLICERYPDQPLTYVMEQFGQAKAMCLQIERTFNAPEVDLGEEAEAPAEEAVRPRSLLKPPKRSALPVAALSASLLKLLRTSTSSAVSAAGR